MTLHLNIYLERTGDPRRKDTFYYTCYYVYLNKNCLRKFVYLKRT